nr:MAG TPA: hypothetical protein [Caudoviricetes sp.]
MCSLWKSGCYIESQSQYIVCLYYTSCTYGCQ